MSNDQFRRSSAVFFAESGGQTSGDSGESNADLANNVEMDLVGLRTDRPTGRADVRDVLMPVDRRGVRQPGSTVRPPVLEEDAVGVRGRGRQRPEEEADGADADGGTTQRR